MLGKVSTTHTSPNNFYNKIKNTKLQNTKHKTQNKTKNDLSTKIETNQGIQVVNR
jgi:hypothetical protein